MCVLPRPALHTVTAGGWVTLGRPLHTMSLAASDDDPRAQLITMKTEGEDRRRGSSGKDRRPVLSPGGAGGGATAQGSECH